MAPYSSAGAEFRRSGWALAITTCTAVRPIPRSLRDAPGLVAHPCAFWRVSHIALRPSAPEVHADWLPAGRKLLAQSRLQQLGHRLMVSLIDLAPELRRQSVGIGNRAIDDGRHGRIADVAGVCNSVAVARIFQVAAGDEKSALCKGFVLFLRRAGSNQVTLPPCQSHPLDARPTGRLPPNGRSSTRDPPQPQVW